MEQVFEKILKRLEADEKHTFDGCINKRYAKQIVQEVAEEYRENQILDAMKQRNSDVKAVIKELRSICNNGWIPCSEQSPDVSETGCEEFNVTIKGATASTTLTYYEESKQWTDESGNVYDVIAWQSLPEAYKENE